jgi:hypothetical protein
MLQSITTPETTISNLEQDDQVSSAVGHHQKLMWKLHKFFIHNSAEAESVSYSKIWMS